MAVNTPVPAELREWREERLRTGIAPREGCEAFARLVPSKIRQVVVCPRDFPAMVANAGKVELRNLTGARASSPLVQTHVRPHLSRPYVAPGTPAEEVVARIWREVMGVDPVGVNDDFFELGGHSVLALQMLPRFRDAFHVDIPLRELFERRTVAEVAALIEERVLADIEALSDAEVARLTSAE